MQAPGRIRWAALAVKKPSKQALLLLKEARERYALGHSKGCACKPCAALRNGLIKLRALHLIYGVHND